jgi:hypothetical protein
MERRKRWLRAVGLGLTVLVGAGLTVGEVHANKDDALKILKAMSSYISSQKTISASFDANIEVVTHELEKIQFNNSGQILLSRPDKLRASRVGGYADVELVFDGKTATLLGRNINAYTQLQIAGTTDQLFDRLRNDLGMQVPGADLLLTNVFAELSRDIVEAKHIGAGVIGGLECEHLAFRNEETDWQLWVQKGAQPIPTKLVITSKSITGAPQYTLTIREWRTDAPTPADMFAFKAPAGAKSVKLEELTDMDELPAGVVKGGAK